MKMKQRKRVQFLVVLGGLVILLAALSVRRALTWQPKASPTPLPTATTEAEVMPSLRPMPDSVEVVEPANLQPKATTCSTCGR